MITKQTIKLRKKDIIKLVKYGVVRPSRHDCGAHENVLATKKRKHTDTLTLAYSHADDINYNVSKN